MTLGRPSSYTEEIAEEVCRRIADGETLAEICRDDHIPPRRTVLDWALQDRAGFSARYARARDLQIEHWADEMLSIADDGSNDWMERNDPENPGFQLNGEHVQRSRLRSANRQWLLSKLKPQQYGDRVEHVGAGGKDLIPERANEPDRMLGAFVALLKSGSNGG